MWKEICLICTDRGYSVHLSMLWVGRTLFWTCLIRAGVSFLSGLCCKGSAESDHALLGDLSNLYMLCYRICLTCPCFVGGLSHLPMLCWGISLICKCFVWGSVSSAGALLEDLSHLSKLCWGICLICPCPVGWISQHVS